VAVLLVTGYRSPVTQLASPPCPFEQIVRTGTLSTWIGRVNQFRPIRLDSPCVPDDRWRHANERRTTAPPHVGSVPVSRSTAHIAALTSLAE